VNNHTDSSGLHGPATAPGPPVDILDVEECWSLLGERGIGRLAVSVAGDIDIYPVNYVLDGRDIVFRTAEGTKLVEVVIAGLVAFETDRQDADTGHAWSVVIKGRAEMLERFDDIYHAESLGIRPWVSTPKDRFVRITARSVSGRRFRGEPV
jgi:nitroimidazol reductase NimA-like FMN-containing flavoprotein (pyridoxamine 5'-phosphate oxidase superfamily)